jgi:hypothetical protein
MRAMILWIDPTQNQYLPGHKASSTLNSKVLGSHRQRKLLTAECNVLICLLVSALTLSFHEMSSPNGKMDIEQSPNHRSCVSCYQVLYTYSLRPRSRTHSTDTHRTRRSHRSHSRERERRRDRGQYDERRKRSRSRDREVYRDRERDRDRSDRYRRREGHRTDRRREHSRHRDRDRDSERDRDKDGEDRERRRKREDDRERENVHKRKKLDDSPEDISQPRDTPHVDRSPERRNGSRSSRPRDDLAEPRSHAYQDRYDDDDDERRRTRTQTHSPPPLRQVLLSYNFAVILTQILGEALLHMMPLLMTTTQRNPRKMIQKPDLSLYLSSLRG